VDKNTIFFLRDRIPHPKSCITLEG